MTGPVPPDLHPLGYASCAKPRPSWPPPTRNPPTRPRAPTDAHEHPYTLAIDIGGTGLKANVLDAKGGFVADRVQIPTTYPMPPDLMVEKLNGLANKLPEADRISAGFPGMVRRGHVLTAPHFVYKKGPGTELDPKLLKDWTDFDLASALSKAIGKPARVANDADVQGLAVIAGKGFEAVITLGTGFGTAFFMAGGCSRTWSSPTSSSARARPSTSSWASRPARRSATSAGTSGCRRRSPTSTR